MNFERLKRYIEKSRHYQQMAALNINFGCCYSVTTVQA